MSVSKLRKCGPFMEKDGVVVKRPGKKFRCPQMPKTLEIPYYEGVSPSAREDIAQMNALKAQNWRKARKAEYTAMKRLYYFQQCVKFVSKTCEKILIYVDASNKRMIDPNAYSALHSSRYHS